MADKAVLAGINTYKGISPLRGCANDVRTMKSLLCDVFRFDASNVRTLFDEDVTKERVEKEWKWLMRDARPGDRLVFHCSGHGSFIDDKDGDESDGADELFCLYDMDFDNDRTYLLDDDLRRFTEQVPAGVYLTVILDACHSGTGTRLALGPAANRGLVPEGSAPLVDMASSIKRLRQKQAARGLSARDFDTTADSLLAARRLSEARDTVLVRFVMPPQRVLAAIAKGGVRRSLRTGIGASKQGGFRDASGMNHVLLAGCRDNQTSADAYIDSDYFGAFTYHLDRTVRRLGAEAKYNAVMQTLVPAINDAGFSQIPQLEPDGHAGTIFGGGRRDEDNGREDRPPEAPSRVDEPSGDGPAIGNLLDEFTDLVAKLRVAVREREMGPTTRTPGASSLVYVHGICRHDPGYSNPWWRAMKSHLAPALRQQLETNRLEVLWSDLVTSHSASRAASTRQVEREQDLAASLRDVLEDRAQREALAAAEVQRPGVAPRAAPTGRARAVLGIPGVDCVDDFAKYLLSDTIRRDVQARFTAEVRPLLRAGHEVFVISHSWGTVVAYEALRHMDDESNAGGVSRWFTVGSALSIALVRRRLEFTDGRRPRAVERWINLDAHGDIVGGSLSSSYDVDEEFLNLHPTTCNVVLGMVSPSCAHSSYFEEENRAVNRDIFAASIQS